jgi:hypothetical protein
MDCYELTKTIEARKLNKRTRVPTGEPPVTVPFGSILENIAEDGDVVKFSYLGEPYQCSLELFKVASVPIRPLASARPAAVAPQAPPVTAPAAEAEAAANASRGVRLDWEPVDSNSGRFSRARVHGGWLLQSPSGALVFVPDAGCAWTGTAQG